MSTKPFLPILIFLLFPIFAFASPSEETISSNLSIIQNTIWSGTKIINGAKITVENTATLTLEPGTTVIGLNGASIYIKGRFIAIGEENHKIRFTSDKDRQQNFTLTYSLSSIAGSEVEMRNFILEDGGGNQDLASLPALTLKGKGTLSDCIIRRNRTTGVRFWDSVDNESIENCEIYENENLAIENKTTNLLKAENNWWGSKDGPSYFVSAPRAYIWGNIDFDPWQQKGPIPIILVPGFGGSFSFKLFSNSAKNDWWMTPLGTGSYRYFAKALASKNYTLGQDYFWAFYDWRKLNEESAQNYLKKTIEEAKQKSDHNEVNLVAHSMGGLLARSYIQSDNFEDDVDRLVTAGTPHLGSSETYSLWEGGELLGAKKILLPYLWYLEILNRNYSNIDTLRNEFPSLAEMLPTYDYLYQKDSGETISYASQKYQNSFLESINSDLKNLKRKVWLGVVAGTGEKTLEKIPVKACTENSNIFEDGVPDPLNSIPDSLFGDGTVTQKSATLNNQLTNNSITIPSSHGELFQKGQKNLFDELNIRPSTFSLADILDDFLFSSSGPIDISIENEAGKILNTDAKEINESEYDEEEIEGKKLVFASFPINYSTSLQKQSLKITVLGKDEGTAKLAFWHFSSNEDFDKVEKEIGTDENSKVIYTVSLEKGLDGKPKINITDTDSLSFIKTRIPLPNDNYLNWQYLLPEAYIWSGEDDEKIESSKVSYSLDQKDVSGSLDLSSLPLGHHEIKVRGSWLKKGVSQNDEKEIPFVISTSLKSFSTLLDRFYKEGKINSWKDRSNLTNLSSLAYQDLSEGDLNGAKNKIREIKNTLLEKEDLFKDKKDKEIMNNSIAYLENNPN